MAGYRCGSSRKTVAVNASRVQKKCLRAENECRAARPRQRAARVQEKKRPRRATSTNLLPPPRPRDFPDFPRARSQRRVLHLRANAFDRAALRARTPVGALAVAPRVARAFRRTRGLARVRPSQHWTQSPMNNASSTDTFDTFNVDFIKA